MSFTLQSSNKLSQESEIEVYDNVDSVLDSNISKESKGTEILGRRIINFGYFFEQIKSVNNHNSVLGCTIDNMMCIKETRFSLKSKIYLKCNMCNLECNISTEDVGCGMDVNTASVAGAMAVGIGHSQLEELLSAMEIPTMSLKTYLKYHDHVSDGWEATALQEMESAAQEEIKLAIEEGNVSKDGLPILTVVADGGWAKRSYRTNYTSLSGVVSHQSFHTTII